MKSLGQMKNDLLVGDFGGVEGIAYFIDLIRRDNDSSA
jgi:hypothetical protein